MKNMEENGDPGDETMKQVGRLDEIVSEESQDKKSCEADAEEVANWITAIGRAIRAIFAF